MNLVQLEQAPQPQTAPHLRLVEPYEPPGEPLVIVIPETPEDMWSRARAERVIKRAGEAVVSDQVQIEPVPETETDTVDLNLNLKRAKAGDQTAFKSILANVSTEGSEIVYKAGIIVPAELDVDEAGNISQHGQTSESVSYNALRYAAFSPGMKARARAEARNHTRLEDVNRQGKLKDAYFVVISRVPEKSDKWLEDNHFFAETKSLTIQLTTENEDGSLSLQSVFIAGVTELGGERHDIQAIEAFGRKLGVDLSNLTDSELIDKPLLISKQQLPNGGADVAELMDQSIEEIVGKPVFFGQDQAKQDYVEYIEFSRQKLAALEPKTLAAAHKLISEADTFKDPVEASKRLHKIVEAEMVKQAVQDETINPRVFGKVAAGHIEAARAHVLQGDMLQALNSVHQAVRTAKSLSCPSSLRDAEAAALGKVPGNTEDESMQDEACKEVKNGEIVNCPFCDKKVKAIVPKKGGEIFCSNDECKAAHDSVKNKKSKPDDDA